jgi:hypothetical protein
MSKQISGGVTVQLFDTDKPTTPLDSTTTGPTEPGGREVVQTGSE